MSYLRYLCLLAYNDVQRILSCVLLCFPASCVPNVAGFSGLSIVYCPSVFSNVYFNYDTIHSLLHLHHCIVCSSAIYGFG